VRKGSAGSGKDVNRLAVAWGLVLVVSLLAGCGARLQPATTALLDETEARWRDNPVLGYRLVAQVDRPGDVRRVELLVEQERIVTATVRYREKGLWGGRSDLSQKQAWPFSVPGLFEMVRGELASSGRGSIQVGLDDTYPFPRKLVLGPVYQDGQAVSGTEATMTVRIFEPTETQQ
jgi:hypothetical protein